MGLQFIVLIVTAVTIVALVIYMRAQKAPTGALALIAQHRYEEAVRAAAAADPMHRAEALKLLGRFDEAAGAYRESDDPSAREGIALSLAHAGHDLPEARRLMDETIALHPQIQEFQALALAYVLLRSGDNETALRVFRDNLELLETRFRDDYTDPDPLLAETLWIFAALCDANGDPSAARMLRLRAAEWAPGSVWATHADGTPVSS